MSKRWLVVVGFVAAAAVVLGCLQLGRAKKGDALRGHRARVRPVAAGRVRVAAVQSDSDFGNPGANRKRLERLVRRAAARGAKIVVLPETAITGYLTPDLKTTWQVNSRRLSGALRGADPRRAAEAVPGPSTKRFSRLADALDIYLSVPLLEVDRKTGRYYNTVVLVGPDGRHLLHYRKRNPWPWAEQGWATPGDRGNPVVDTPYGRLGALICYDIHEQAAIMGALKVDLLLYSIAWVDDPGSDWFSRQLPAIARANDLTIIGANWTLPFGAPRPDWHGYGQSTIIERGRVLRHARRDIGAEIVLADVQIRK